VFPYFLQRHLDKGSDLAEAASASGLRELARSLKQHLRGFGSRLEDRREYLEDTSRCCLLQDRAYEWAQEARLASERRSQQFLMARPPLPPEHFTEMIALAEKLGNEVLLEQCRIARNKCVEALEIARTASAPGSPARRRSFAASESTSWDDTLAKRKTSVSFLYQSPIQGTRMNRNCMFQEHLGTTATAVRLMHARWRALDQVVAVVDRCWTTSPSFEKVRSNFWIAHHREHHREAQHREDLSSRQ
jgi:hypothetical protein